MVKTSVHVSLCARSIQYYPIIRGEQVVEPIETNAQYECKTISNKKCGKVFDDFMRRVRYFKVFITSTILSSWLLGYMTAYLQNTNKKEHLIAKSLVLSQELGKK